MPGRRRGAGAGQSRRGGRFQKRDGGIEYLLDYADANFVRATEAANYDPRTGAYVESTEPANWLGTGVPCIYADGAVRVEGARTNKMPESSLGTWTLIGSASVSSDDATAPDYDTNADTVTFAALATDAVTHPTSIAADASTDNDSAWVSCWLRCTSGTEEARIGLLDKDTTTRLLSADLTVTTTWTRFEFEVADIGAGVVAPAGLIQNSSDAAARSIEAWGFQVEHNAPFVSSDIRTSGAAATRNRDDLEFGAGADLGAVINSQTVQFDFWCAQTSAEYLADLKSRVLFGITGTNEQFLIAAGGGLVYVKINGASGLLSVQHPCTWTSRHQKITVTYDASTATITVAGATTGNGSTVGTVRTFTEGAAMKVGLHGNSDVDNFQFYGVLSRWRSA